MRRLITIVLVVVVLSSVAGCHWLDRGRPRPGSVADATATAPAPESEDRATRDIEPTPTPAPTPDATALEAALRDEDWVLRLEAAWSLPDRADLPVEQRATMLLDALEAPWEGEDEVPDHDYLPASNGLRLELTRALGELGAEAIPALRRAAAGGDEVGRECALLALGHLGQRDVIPDLIALLRDSYYVEVRMEAARVLGILGANEAIPDLEAALNDPYFAYGSDSLGEYTICPVREQAAGALEALGVDVERLEDDEFRVRRP